MLRAPPQAPVRARGYTRAGGFTVRYAYSSNNKQGNEKGRLSFIGIYEIREPLLRYRTRPLSSEKRSLSVLAFLI